MLDHDYIARQFPRNDGEIFLNVAFEGRRPLRVVEAYGKELFNFRFTSKTRSLVLEASTQKEAQQNLAELFHCEPGEIAFCESVTEGVSMFASSYPWGPNDNVVLYEKDYPALVYPFLHCAPNCRIVPTIPDRGVKADDLINMVDENTRVIALASVQSFDGSRLDIEKLGDFCWKHGIDLCVDSIQGAGRLDLDVKKCHISYMACGGFKAMLNHLGCAFVYCDKDVAQRVVPIYFSEHGNVEKLGPAGHFNVMEQFSCYLNGFAEAAAFINELGIKDIEEYVLDLETYFRKKLGKLDPGLRSDLPSGVVFMNIDPAMKPIIQQKLAERKIITGVRDTNMRMSFDFWNTYEDADALAEVLHEVFD